MQDLDYDQYKPATSYKNKLVIINFPSSVTLTQFLTSAAKCWPLGETGTSNSKTMVGIAVTTKL
jgi:ribosomal protein S18